MAPNEASSLLASRPNENHLSALVLLRRYRESQLTKWGVPPGWGCGVGKLKFFVLNLLAYLLNQILCSEVSVSHQHLHVPMT